MGSSAAAPWRPPSDTASRRPDRATIGVARGGSQHLRRRTSELWETTRGGALSPLDQITASWAAAHHAVDAANATLEGAYAAAGTTALYTDCPLERAHRDLHAMLRHIVAQPVWLEDAGRLTLGMAPTHPLYAL